MLSMQGKGVVIRLLFEGSGLPQVANLSPSKLSLLKLSPSEPPALHCCFITWLLSPYCIPLMDHVFDNLCGITSHENPVSLVTTPPTFCGKMTGDAAFFGGGCRFL